MSRQINRQMKILTDEQTYRWLIRWTNMLIDRRTGEQDHILSLTYNLVKQWLW